MECKICDIIKEKRNMIYEDDEVFVFLKEKPATAGHIMITTKKHYQIIEQIPDKLVAKLFNLANTFSSIIFESLKSGGTNVIVQNGIPAGQTENHFLINVIARRNGDGLKFDWEAKEGDKEELSLIKLKLEKETNKIIPNDKGEKKTEQVKEKDAEEVKAEYLLNQLKRMP